MEFINKIIETYKQETGKTLTETAKKTITKILLNSKINLKGSNIND